MAAGALARKSRSWPSVCASLSLSWWAWGAVWSYLQPWSGSAEDSGPPVWAHVPLFRRLICLCLSTAALFLPVFRPPLPRDGFAPGPSSSPTVVCALKQFVSPVLATRLSPSPAPPAPAFRKAAGGDKSGPQKPGHPALCQVLWGELCVSKQMCLCHNLQCLWM